MSRGAGTVMRAALTALREAGTPERAISLDTLEITGRVYGKQTVSDAEYSSVRRALRRLYELGQVGERGRGRNKRRYWYAAEHHAQLTAAAVSAFGQRGADMYKIKPAPRTPEET